MKGSTRNELLEVVAELGELAPELRLGQLIANVATLARGPQAESVWDAEDEELLAAAETLRDRLRERAESAAR